MRSFFLDSRFFIGIGVVVVMFLAAYAVPELMSAAQLLMMGLLAVTLVDTFLLYGTRGRFMGGRDVADRLSNGDDNEIRLHLRSGFRFPVHVRIIDELPPQFQRRDLQFETLLTPGQEKGLAYTVRPVRRGAYGFGSLHFYVASRFGFVRRRFSTAQNQEIPVYPSFLQMRRYELLAISDRLSEAGIKKIRKVGHTMEFDQIREYVRGDDYRTVNWKATARRGNLMVNQYQDEKSQHIYCVVDKGRVMMMPFEEMTLLDYAINASLVLSNIAVLKQDRAGLVTFAERVGTILPADRRSTQILKINELLYNQQTDFLESNYEALYAAIRTRITNRSLLMLFTNFETLGSLERQLPSIRKIARDHLLVVVFFENTELRSLRDRRAERLEEIFLKTIGEKFAYEKRRIVKELERYGIHSILTTPRNLTVNAINKYLELKARRLI